MARKPTLWMVMIGLAVVPGVAGCRQSDVSVSGEAPSTTRPPVVSTTSTTTTVAATTSTTETTTTTIALAPLLGLALEAVADGFVRPTLVTTAPGDERLFVLEASGLVEVVNPDGTLRNEPFLDLRSEVNDGGIEQGLLGLAFHPDYRSNGRLFAYYSGPGDDTHLVELTGDPVAGTADPAGLRHLIDIAKPTSRHNGGMLEFGPDGYLYLSLGEGGAARDNGQNPSTLLSSILRLDVDGAVPYGVPADNPFVNGGGAAEVWAYGLRNPWRFDIDPVDGLLYVADVGHSDWEEINVVPLSAGGLNYGWPLMEATHCFFEDPCSPEGRVVPVIEYSHDDGCSVTGGFVYRGAAIPELDGHYFYADWCSGWVRSFRYLDGAAAEQQDWSADLAGIGQIDSFGLDPAGELLVVTYDGRLERIVPVR